MEVPSTTCRERHNILMKNEVDWDRELDQRLEKAYMKRREDMWKPIAGELGVSWRAAEDRLWELGKKRFARK